MKCIFDKKQTNENEKSDKNEKCNKKWKSK